MKAVVQRICLSVLASGISCIGMPLLPAKEFLTPKEIEKIQEAQELDKRVKLYLDAATLRLKTVEERFRGQESNPGDPLEFFSIEEMLEGYCRIVRSVMFNVDDSFQNPASDREKLSKALKNLKDTTEKASKDLQVLKRLAEEKKNEEAWNLVSRGIEITGGAREGAETGLARFPGKSKTKTK